MVAEAYKDLRKNYKTDPNTAVHGMADTGIMDIFGGHVPGGSKLMVLQGLVRKPELNVTFVDVYPFLEKSGRWEVETHYDVSDSTLYVKAASVRMLTHADPCIFSQAEV